MPEKENFSLEKRENISLGIIEIKKVEEFVKKRIENFTNKIFEEEHQVQFMEIGDTLRNFGFTEWPFSFEIIDSVNQYLQKNNFDLDFQSFTKNIENEPTRRYYRSILRNFNFVKNMYKNEIEKKNSFQTNFEEFFDEKKVDILGKIFLIF